MDKAEWKEARKYYSIPKIFYYWTIHKLKQLKWYLYHLWYKLTKYEHKHIWTHVYRCLICRKDKRDIDRERIEGKRFKNWKPPKFKKITGDLYKTKYGWIVTCPENLDLGKNTDIGVFTYINARYHVVIEDDVQIGSHCSIYSEDTERGVHGKIVISKGVKIGAHSVILPREGGSLIIKNIKAGSVIF